MPKAKPASKQENTEAKAVPVVEKPRAIPREPPVRECNIDSAVRDLLPDEHPLMNALMWEYVEHGNESVATLTKAINEYEVTGWRRVEKNATSLAAVYWSLHSKYLAMTSGVIRAIYGDVLGHVLSLASQYGTLFIGENSNEMKTLHPSMDYCNDTYGEFV